MSEMVVPRIWVAEGTQLVPGLRVYQKIWTGLLMMVTQVTFIVPPQCIGVGPRNHIFV